MAIKITQDTHGVTGVYSFAVRSALLAEEAEVSWQLLWVYQPPAWGVRVILHLLPFSSIARTYTLATEACAWLYKPSQPKHSIPHPSFPGEQMKEHIQICTAGSYLETAAIRVIPRNDWGEKNKTTRNRGEVVCQPDLARLIKYICFQLKMTLDVVLSVHIRGYILYTFYSANM